MTELGDLMELCTMTTEKVFALLVTKYKDLTSKFDQSSGAMVITHRDSGRAVCEFPSGFIGDRIHTQGLPSTDQDKKIVMNRIVHDVDKTIGNALLEQN